MTVVEDIPQRLLPAPGADGYWDLTEVAASKREATFEEFLSTALVDMAVRIDATWTAASFQSWARRRWIQDLALVEAGCDPCQGMRGKRRAARAADPYLGVTVLREGSETLVVGDATFDMRPGDAVVWRSDQPIRFQVHSPQIKQTLIIPLIALEETSGGNFLFRPLLLDRTAPATELFTGYLALLARTLDRLSASEMRAARSAALELLIPAARHHVTAENGGATEPPIALMKDWIEQRLRLGDITALSIAAAHGMSVRGVYRVFEEAGETVGAFVRARRLARARRDLAAGAGSIADIAVRWGFSDPSHFARAFRAEYGCAPRDYRTSAATLS